jgi:DNA-binding transcriptional LysR family regulator
VLREPGSGTRQAAEHFFAAHGLALRPRLELGSNEAVKQAVAGGLGLSLLSAHALAHAVDEGIAVLRVTDTPVLTQWQVVHPRGKRLTPLADAFLRFLEVRAPDLDRNAQARLAAAQR